MEILIGGFLLLVLAILIAAVLWWRFVPTSSLQNAPLSTATPNTSAESQLFPSNPPALTNPLAGLESHKVKATVSKHALKIERKGDRTLYWFDGVPYSNWEEIPDATVRDQARQLLPQLDQANLTLGSAKTRIVVNGVTYNSLDEIGDPRLRQAAQEALKKAGH